MAAVQNLYNNLVPRVSYLSVLSLWEGKRWETWERDGPIKYITRARNHYNAQQASWLVRRPNWIAIVAVAKATCQTNI